jgi:tripartite-type tricarboxylate transporter receptor subunit TctC
MRIRLLPALLCAMLALTAPGADAQDYPNREVTLVVGFPAGGATDVLARILAEAMSTTLGQRMIVENRPGANGARATRSVVRAAPDGYTLILGSSNMATNLAGMKEPGYTLDELVAIGGLAYAPMALVVNTASSQATSLKEFVAYGKANPGKLKYASFGPQSVANLAAQRFGALTGIGWREVPYKGAPQIVQDLINGNVDAYFGLTTVASGVGNRPNVAVLAFSDTKRAAQLKDVPTFAEVGYPELADSTLAGLFAPAGTPKPVADRLKKALADAKTSAKLREGAEKSGNLIYEGTPEQFDADVRKAAEQYIADFKRLGIEPE